MFKGKTFSSRVAVAHEDSLCGCVLFSVPMETATAEHLLLDAASKADFSGLGAGQLRDTRSIQPSTRVDACSGVVAEEGSSTPPPHSAPATTQEETLTVRAVTRGQARKLAENKVHNEDVHVSTSDPQSFDDDDSEFGRLAAIDMSYTPPSVGAGSVDSSASGVDLLKGSDEDGNNEGGEGSADSDGQLGVSPPKLDCNLLPNTTVSPEPCIVVVILQMSCF